MNISLQKTLHVLFISLICLGTLAGQNPFEIKSKLSEEQVVTGQEVITEFDTSTTLISESVPHIPNSQNPFEKSIGESKAKKPTFLDETSERIVNKKTTNLGTLPKTLILFGSLFSLFLIRNINQKVIQNLYESMLNNSKLVSFRNSFTGVLTMQLFLFYLFFFFSIAYFFYNASSKLGWSLPYTGFKLFGIMFLGAFLIYFVKYIIMYLIEYGLEIRRVVSIHLFSVSVHNIILGFALFVINVFFPFAEGGFATILFYIGLVIIAGFYLFRQVKGLAFLSEMRQFNMFHFFIYLCACEISPLIIASKFIIG